jgi:hypothetical protein
MPLQDGGFNIPESSSIDCSAIDVDRLFAAPEDALLVFI